MKDDNTSRELQERFWRKELTQSEQHQLHEGTADNERARDLSLESRLTSMLRGLPDTPVSSNFTQRVLNAVDLETASQKRRNRSRSLVFRWVPRVAIACAVAVAGLISYEKKLESRRGEEMARSVAMISAPSLPSPEILKDFDAIQVMSRSPAADEQLLALME